MNDLRYRWHIYFLRLFHRVSYHRLPQRKAYPGGVDDVYAHTARPRSYGGGTFAYAIRVSMARRLLSLVERHGMTQAVDWFLINAMRDVGREEEEVSFDGATAKIGSEVEEDSPFLRFYPRIFAANQMETGSSDTFHGADAIGSTLPHDRDCKALEDETLVSFVTD